jgi:hypothetical protein
MWVAGSGNSGETVTSEVLQELLAVIGSPGWARTSDILINSQALYRLSSRGVARDSAYDRAENSD